MLPFLWHLMLLWRFSSWSSHIQNLSSSWKRNPGLQSENVKLKLPTGWNNEVGRNWNRTNSFGVPLNTNRKSSVCSTNVTRVPSTEKSPAVLTVPFTKGKRNVLTAGTVWLKLSSTVTFALHSCPGITVSGIKSTATLFMYPLMASWLLVIFTLKRIISASSFAMNAKDWVAFLPLNQGQAWNVAPKISLPKKEALLLMNRRVYGGPVALS